MPKTRAQKEEILTDLSEKLSRMKSAVFTSVSGYTMEDANTLRQQGREVGAELFMVKKTLLARALENSQLPVSQDQLEGSVLTTLGFTDEVAPAKLMASFIKDRESLNILGGILEGKFVDASAIKQLATLPGREELLAKVVGSIHAPVSGFVHALSGNLRNLINVLGAIKEAKV